MTPPVPPTPTPVQRIIDLGFKFVCLLFPATMVYIVITDGDGCGDLPRDFKFFPIAGAAALGGALLWSLIDRQKKDYARLRYGLQILTRYFLAYIIMQYGAAKVIDMQFSPSLTNLDTRVADMSPMGVAWSFFGYSFSYEFFIGCSQIIAAFLLVFRRTATLGAILMVTIMANIVFVNFAFDVCVKFFSCSYLVMSLYLLIDDAPRLVNFLLLNRPAGKRIYPDLFRTLRARRIFNVICVFVLILALGYPTYKTNKSRIEYGIGKHTVLYGVWTVDSLLTNNDTLTARLRSDSGWKKMILDNFSSASIKSWTKTEGYFSYGIDTIKRNLTLQKIYPDTLTSIVTEYTLRKDTLRLSGRYNSDSIYVTMHLLRKYFIRK